MFQTVIMSGKRVSLERGMFDVEIIRDVNPTTKVAAIQVKSVIISNNENHAASNNFNDAYTLESDE